MRKDDATLNALPVEVRQVLRGFVKEATTLFGDSLGSLLLYGSAARGDFLPGRSNVNLLVVLQRIDVGTLRQYAKRHRRWSRENIVVPLFVSEEELHRSARLFPLEYLEIRDQHLLLGGRDPFPDRPVEIDGQDLRFACGRELHGNLVRLRQRFVEGGGAPDAMQILLSLSVTAVGPAVRGLLVSLGRPIRGGIEDCFQDLHDTLGVDVAPLLEASRLKRGVISPGVVEMPRLFERYLTALQDLIGRVQEPQV